MTGTTAIEGALPAEAAQRPEVQETETRRLSIVVFSGDMDKALAAFVIATGAAASGMVVTMFFTFWGLKLIQKGGRSEGSPGPTAEIGVPGGSAKC